MGIRVLPDVLAHPDVDMAQAQPVWGDDCDWCGYIEPAVAEIQATRPGGDDLVDVVQCCEHCIPRAVGRALEEADGRRVTVVLRATTHQMGVAA